MVQFILDIDWLSTIEFCNKHGVPHPRLTHNVEASANQLLQVDAVKHRLFREYAKFLNKKLTLDMFVGKDPIFPGFETAKTSEDKDVLRMVGSDQVYAFLDKETFSMNFPRGAERVEQLVEIGIEVNTDSKLGKWIEL